MRVHRLKQPGVFKKIRVAPKGHTWYVPYPYGIHESEEDDEEEENDDSSSEGKGASIYDVRTTFGFLDPSPPSSALGSRFIP